MAGFSYAAIIKGRPYPIGSRAVVRMRKDRNLIYLPVNLNYLWKELHKKEAQGQSIHRGTRGRVASPAKLG